MYKNNSSKGGNKKQGLKETITEIGFLVHGKKQNREERLYEA